MALVASFIDDNRAVRRVLLLTGLWVLGVAASVALAFAAVGIVATRVAPPGVARLTAGGIERELQTHAPTTGATTTAGNARPPATSSTAAPSPTSGGPPPAVGSTTSAVPLAPSTTVPPPTPAPHNTVTTSEGGTLWTRCAGADRIVYVAAVPKSEFERTRDDEGAGGIEQWFESEDHRSTIKAECSDGIVHAEVEEVSKNADD